jgi:dTDP-4-amino-4,6-dideoxygalactose transaminase
LKTEASSGMTTAIPISRPFLGEEELAAVQEPLRDGWVVQGPRVAEFEAKFAAFCGAEHAVATSSCTTALHLGVLGLGAGPGDEVVVPAFTWISTANVVEFAGARPVFCDVDLESFNLDPTALAGLITGRTVGVIPVHLFGRAADMTEINRVVRPRGLWVLEDAACALGTRQGGRHAGSLGDAGCFSFHPRKSITTGEGGMLTTGNGALAALARSLRDHGASRSDHARHTSAGSFRLADYEHLGFNYRMTDLQGALGLVQMDRAGWILAERARQARFYQEALDDLDWLRPPRAPQGEAHGWQAFVCLYAPEEPTIERVAVLHERRDRLMAALESEGISTRPGTHAPVRTAYYRGRYGLAEDSFPAATIAEALSLALPLYAGLADEQLERVAETLRRLGP